MHFGSAAGVSAQVVLDARLLGRPLFETLLCDEGLATGFTDDLEANTTAFLSSVLLAAVTRPTFFLDNLFGSGPLVELLLADGDPLRFITSLRFVIPCPVTEPMHSLLGPELLCATLLPADIKSRECRDWLAVELAKLTGLTLAETSGRVGVPRLRNLSSPALPLGLLDLTLAQVLIPSFLALLSLCTASPSGLDLPLLAAPKSILGNTTVLTQEGVAITASPLPMD